MKSITTDIAGLRPSAPQALPFAPEVEVRAFVLERDEGDVVIYSVDGLGAGDLAGGATRQYLGHWHEAMFAADRPDVPLFVHELDREKTEQRAHVRAGFSRGHALDDDLEVIPIPGHTPGSTAYLWDNGEDRLLFTSDSLYLHDHGEWVVALDVRGSDRAACMESLERIRELDFDVLVPWAAPRGGPWSTRTDAADTRRRIDAVLTRVRRGEDR